MRPKCQKSILEERQDTGAVCGDYACSFNTDCYAWRCGDCMAPGRCTCPPEGCAAMKRLTDEQRGLMSSAYMAGMMAMAGSDASAALQMVEGVPENDVDQQDD